MPPFFHFEQKFRFKAKIMHTCEAFLPVQTYFRLNMLLVSLIFTNCKCAKFNFLRIVLHFRYGLRDEKFHGTP